VDLSTSTTGAGTNIFKIIDLAARTYCSDTVLHQVDSEKLVKLMISKDDVKREAFTNTGILL
jgi:hypothetical protein